MLLLPRHLRPAAWGGPGYATADIFDLSRMEPYSLHTLHAACHGLPHALYLPRTSDLRRLLPCCRTAAEAAKKPENEPNNLTTTTTTAKKDCGDTRRRAPSRWFTIAFEGPARLWWPMCRLLELFFYLRSETGLSILPYPLSTPDFFPKKNNEKNKIKITYWHGLVCNWIVNGTWLGGKPFQSYCYNLEFISEGWVSYLLETKRAGRIARFIRCCHWEGNLQQKIETIKIK